MDVQNDFYVLNFGVKIVIMTNFCITLAFLGGNLNVYDYIIIFHEAMLQVFRGFDLCKINSHTIRVHELKTLCNTEYSKLVTMKINPHVC